MVFRVPTDRTAPREAVIVYRRPISDAAAGAPEVGETQITAHRAAIQYDVAPGVPGMIREGEDALLAEDAARLVVPSPDECGERPVIGPSVKSQVVDLEPWVGLLVVERPVKIAGALHGDLVHVPGKRRPRWVELEVIRVRPVIIPRGRILRRSDHTLTAFDEGSGSVPRHDVLSIRPSMLEVESAEERTAVQKIAKSRVAHIAVRRRKNAPNDRSVAVQVASHASNEIVGLRLDQRGPFQSLVIDEAPALAGGDGILDADRPRAGLSAHLYGAEDRRLLRRVDVRHTGTA